MQLGIQVGWLEVCSGKDAQTMEVAYASKHLLTMILRPLS